MAVTPEDLLAFVETLLGDGEGTEVDWRNAASRAYYAAYHRCRLVADAARLSVGESRSAHHGLVSELVAPLSPPSLKALGYMLEQCRLHRVQADYRIDEDFERGDAESVLANCQRIMVKADAI